MPKKIREDTWTRYNKYWAQLKADTVIHKKIVGHILAGEKARIEKESNADNKQNDHTSG